MKNNQVQDIQQRVAFPFSSSNSLSAEAGRLTQISWSHRTSGTLHRNSGSRTYQGKNVPLKGGYGG